MNPFSDMKTRRERYREIERGLERPILSFALALWPFSEPKLILFVSAAAFLDYASTFTFLSVNSSKHVVEGGPLASWALDKGGFAALLLTDALSVAILISLALGVRFLFRKLGFAGFGRAAFTFVLIPYAVIILAVIFNNILLSFVG